MPKSQRARRDSRQAERFIRMVEKTKRDIAESLAAWPPPSPEAQAELDRIEAGTRAFMAEHGEQIGKDLDEADDQPRPIGDDGAPWLAARGEQWIRSNSYDWLLAGIDRELAGAA